MKIPKEHFEITTTISTIPSM